MLSQKVCFRCDCNHRELFETDHISNNEIGAISQKVSILSYDAWTALSEEERDSSFFCDQFYSYKTGYLRPILDHSNVKKLERIHLYSYQHNELASETSKRKRSHPTDSKAKRSRLDTEDKLEVAKEHLMLTHVPSRIPCRESERKQIADYIKNSILQKGNGSPLYISGSVKHGLL